MIDQVPKILHAYRHRVLSIAYDSIILRWRARSGHDILDIAHGSWVV